ncbi:MAG: N-acetylmuramoyl-L-alanine amidase [Verrucomicrobiales bacterium]|jgi:N-acetylmuramoyl-L-alanine amidase|nr:N-acetylmuramoyl-L-alanine amidase [Verrucomicrobiales bacterium]NCF88013.1 hypothetical protein [Verrucomicrobiaceae bacterium]
MKLLMQNGLSIFGAGLFLICMGMMLTRPSNFASYVPEIAVELEARVEDPTVRIVLDAGHGGHDGGSSYVALREKDLALKVVKLVRGRLEAARLENVEVVLTREDDRYLTLHQRVAVANRYPKAFFVSVHFNASKHRSASGTETYHANPKPNIIENQLRRQLQLDPDVPILDTRGERFARSVQDVLVRRLGTRDRGVRNNRKFVLPREVIGPSILVECVFLSNQSEGLKLHSARYIEDIASSLSEGILNYVKESGNDPYDGITPLSGGDELLPAG